MTERVDGDLSQQTRQDYFSSGARSHPITFKTCATWEKRVIGSVRRVQPKLFLWKFAVDVSCESNDVGQPDLTLFHCVQLFLAPRIGSRRETHHYQQNMLLRLHQLGLFSNKGLCYQSWYSSRHEEWCR